MYDASAILIPTYEPSYSVVILLDQLKSLFTGSDVKVVVVNDGTRSADSLLIVDELRRRAEVIVLDHVVNLGKGEALKSGLRYIKNSLCHIEYVVTADSDGQHLGTDILKVLREVVSKNKVVLGVRAFKENVPLRSWIGNVVSRRLFRLIFRMDIQDTQTGLRGLPMRVVPDLLQIPYQGYDFELEMLINLIKNNEVVQQPISTIYDKDNSHSHFRPITDSLKIYAIFFRHILLSIIGTILYFVLFQIFLFSGVNVFGSLLVSRLLSIPFFFPLARKFVFRSKGNIETQVLIFSLLTIVNFTLLWLFIELSSSRLGLMEIVAMVLGQIFLFFVNFWIENKIIFRSNSMG